MELRKVLDYLEDRLEASEVAEVGASLRGRPEGRALLDRIRKLSKPGVVDGRDIDPNLIGAYLDGTLSEEAARDLERETQQNDALLAEIIGAHSCLPRESPTGDGLAWGQRAGLNIHRLLRAAGQRTMTRVLPAPAPQPAGSKTKRLPVTRGRTRGILSTLAAGLALLLMAWAGFVWESGMVTAPPKAEEPAPEPMAVNPVPPRVAPEVRPVPVNPMPAPVPPPMPAPVAELKPQLPMPVEADTTTRRKACAAPGRGGVLLAQNGAENPWRRVSAGDEVFTQDLLMAVPGFMPELDLPGGARMVLWGNMPEASGNPMVQECELRMHPPGMGITADFTLMEGRAYLKNEAKTVESVFHVRFAGETWEVRLLGPGAEVLVEKVPMPVSEEAWLNGSAVGTEVILASIRGRARVQVGPAHGLDLDAVPSDRAFISWNSLRGVPAGPFAMRADEPLWNAEGARSGRDRQAYIAAFRELDQALARGINPLVALDNIVNRASSTSAARLTALTVLGCLGDFNRLYGEMTDEQATEERRQAAAGSLRHWVSESTDRAKLLHDPNTETGYLTTKRELTSQEAAYLVRLLLPMGEVQARDHATQKALVTDLSHPRMAIRVAAQRALTDLAVGPFIHKSPVVYNSRGSEASWRLAQGSWNRLIDQGKLPGKPVMP